jgi:hypothetical protein
MSMSASLQGAPAPPLLDEQIAHRSTSVAFEFCCVRWGATHQTQARLVKQIRRLNVGQPLVPQLPARGRK